MSPDEQRIDAQLRLAETDGPLPPGVEERIWNDVAATYADAVVGGSAPRRTKPNRPGSSQITWLAAAAAAVLLAAIGWQLTAGSGDATDTAGVGPWVDRVAAQHAATNDAVPAAYALTERTASTGLASWLPYLDAVIDNGTAMADALTGAPVDVAVDADRYREALDAWALLAEELRADLADQSDDFVFEVGLLETRLDELRASETAALEEACTALEAAGSNQFGLGDQWIECGVLTPPFPWQGGG